MWCIVQLLRVLQDTLDLSRECLDEVNATADEVKMSFRRYLPEDDHPVQPGRSDLEDPIWAVVYDPNKDSRELGKCDGRHRHVYSFDKVSMEIGER